jgi:hypothetical protein
MAAVDERSSDAEQMDALMRAFYEVISFEDGGAPDWARMASLFSPHARITRLTPEGVDYLDLKSFRDMADEMMELGAYTSFYEREIARRADRYGHVMHMASAYETKVSATASDHLERGVNSLQLIREEESWKILSLCWDTAARFSLAGLQPVTNRGE